MKLSLIAAALAALSVTSVSADLLDDTVVMVTQDSGKGHVVAFDLRNRFRIIAKDCPVEFTGMSVVGGIVFAASQSQVHAIPLINGSATDCSAAVALLPIDGARDIQHAEVDSEHVYYTDAVTKAVHRAPLVGGGGVDVFIGDGDDGIIGDRIALSLWRDTVIYSTNGVNASNASIPMRTLVQVKKDLSMTDMLFRYSQAWWIVESAVADDSTTVLLAEYRTNPSPNTNLQRYTLDDVFGGNGGLTILSTNLAQQTTDTYIAYDAINNMAWWTPPHSSKLSYAKATTRNSPPISRETLTVPVEYGMVHGIHYVPGIGQAECYRMQYPDNAPLPSSTVACPAVPTPNPEPTPGPGNGASAVGVSALASAVAVVAGAFAGLRA
jgi:hypothetical protein